MSEPEPPPPPDPPAPAAADAPAPTDAPTPAGDAPAADTPAPDAAAGPAPTLPPAAPEAPPVAPPVAPTLPPPRVSRRRLVIVGVILAAVAALAVTGFYVYHWLVLRTIRHEAAALGVAIDSVDGYTVKRDGVELTGVSFGLEGVDGVTGHADILRTGTERPPTKIAIEGLDMTFEGSAGTWMSGLARWSRDHRNVFDLALTATKVHVVARETKDETPWLELADATLGIASRSLRVDAKDAKIVGARASPLAAIWAADGSHVAFGVGGEPATAPIRAEIRPGKGKVDVEVHVAPTPFAELGQRLRLNVTSRAKVSAQANVTLHDDGGFEGTASGGVDGWVPPHPKEANGIVYGDKTRASASFRTTPDRTKVKLDPVKVQVGGLELKGTGAVVKNQRLGHLAIDLQGAVPCTQAARSAAADVGGVLGGVLGALGEMAVEGNVAIRVKIDGEIADLRNATVTPDVKPNCSIGH